MVHFWHSGWLHQSKPNLHSTDTLTSLTDFTVKGLDNEKQVISIFVDLSKAFDCVDHYYQLFDKLVN